MSTTEPTRAIALSPAAEEAFGEVIVNAVAANLPAELRKVHLIQRFLELAASLQLNPLTGEIWLADFKGKPTVMVGRDGYLVVARRQPDFIGWRGDVVYDNDTFEVAHDVAGTTITHKYGHPKDRGAPCGAWAIVDRRDAPPRYFYAPLAQYDRDHAKSAWKFTDAMVLKAACSYVLRTTYGTSGPVPADEVHIIDVGDVGSPLTAGEGDAPARGIDLAPAVERILARAGELGHAGLAERGNAELATDGQPGEVVARWVADATAELDSLERDGGEVVDAQVADDKPTEPILGIDDRYHADEGFRSKVDVLLNRIADLECLREDQGPAAEVDEELDMLEGQLLALGCPAEWHPSPQTETLFGSES